MYNMLHRWILYLSFIQTQKSEANKASENGIKAELRINKGGLWDKQTGKGEPLFCRLFSVCTLQTR